MPGMGDLKAVEKRNASMAEQAAEGAALLKALGYVKKQNAFGSTSQDIPATYKGINEMDGKTFTPSEFIKPYYGNDENFQKELGDAREHAKQSEYAKYINDMAGVTKRKDYGELEQRAKEGTFLQPNIDKPFTAKSLHELVQSPYPSSGYFKNSEREVAVNPDYNMYITPENFEKVDFQLNSFRPSTETNNKQLGDYNIFQHEVGHAAGTNNLSGIVPAYDTFDSRHMAKPDEYLNQLGNIQRQSYQMFGKRLTPEAAEAYRESQKTKPLDERYLDYDAEARRLWRFLEGDNTRRKELFDLLPSLVQNDSPKQALG